MQPISGKDAAARVKGIINAKYQVHAYSLDLTVRRVFQLDPSGQVDFGGGEYVPAEKLPLVAVRRLREDKYKWWDMARGCYLVEFNETVDLPSDEMGIVEPDLRLLRAGASHTTTFLRGRVEPVVALVLVEVLHVLFKENARISKLRIFRLHAEESKKKPAATKRRGKK